VDVPAKSPRLNPLLNTVGRKLPSSEIAECTSLRLNLLLDAAERISKSRTHQRD